MPGVEVFSRINFGKETTKGTAVARTRRFYGVATGNFDIGDQYAFHEAENRGARVRISAHAPTLLRDRLIALDLRSLLKRGGYCVRIEYAAVRRDQLGHDELLRAGMEEGSLDTAVGRHRPRTWFRLVASSWFRSEVMNDVKHQAGTRERGPSGYAITVLRAV